MIKIGVFIGSLRKDSYSRQIAKSICRQMPSGFRMDILDIGGLPVFNQDFDDDGTTPAEWKAFRRQVEELDGFLFVTPEYNRSIPAVLKNALDVASRPYGYNLWGEKPGAIVSVSTGKPGGFGANHHLRQCMAFLNVYMLQQPEAYIGNVDSILNQNGEVQEGAKKFLQIFADAFADWVRRFSA